MDSNWYRRTAPLAASFAALWLVAGACAEPVDYRKDDEAGDQESPWSGAFDIRYISIDGTADGFTITIGHGDNATPEVRRFTDLSFLTAQRVHSIGCSVGPHNPGQPAEPECHAESHARSGGPVFMPTSYAEAVRFETVDGVVRFHLDTQAMGEGTSMVMEGLLATTTARPGVGAPDAYAYGPGMEADEFRPPGSVHLAPSTPAKPGPEPDAGPDAAEPTQEAAPVPAPEAATGREAPGPTPLLVLGALSALVLRRR